MKAIKDFTTPTAYARWTAIRSNPMNDGLSSKLLLSQILLQVPETFGLSFTVATTSTSQVQQPPTQNVVTPKSNTTTTPSMEELLAEYGKD